MRLIGQSALFLAAAAAASCSKHRSPVQTKPDAAPMAAGNNKDWNGKPLGQAKPPAGTFSSVSAGGDHRHLTRSTHQFALCLAQGAPPFHVVGTGRNCLAVHADGIADAAHATEKIAVVDQGLVAAVAVEA
jgi:hypothetical protein